MINERVVLIKTYYENGIQTSSLSLKKMVVMVSNEHGFDT